MDEREQKRLEAVQRYHILDTPPDSAFDRLAAIAARSLHVPIAVVSIVDRDRIWFKSHYGLALHEVSREPGMCASCILQHDRWLVEDARADSRTTAHSLVTGNQGLQFYLGIPLRTRDGFNLGAMGVMDRRPRSASPDEVAQLTDLAAIIVDELELRLATRHAQESYGEELSRRQRREDHINALLRELAHRSKNLLAVVQAIARQTVSRGETKEEYAASLCARVEGLAFTHDLIAADDWRGAGIEELAVCQLSPFLEPERSRIELIGPRLSLTPVAAQNIGLALHELATNAVKYGALCRPQGRVQLMWELMSARSGPPVLRLTWRERNGPTADPCAHRGFGHVVLDRIVPEALDGRAKLELAAEGATWSLEIPATHVRTV
jgi:two-component sensor histidine kinase